MVNTARLSFDTRDTCIQILDKFLSICVFRNPNMLEDSNFVALAAATSVILSSKMHDSPPLKIGIFSQFTKQELVNFENCILITLNYFIVPLSSPVSFIRYLLHISDISYINNNDITMKLYNESNQIVAYFWEGNLYICYNSICHVILIYIYIGPDSLLFSPAIIALSALVIAFSKLRINCRIWLESISDACFLQLSSTLSNNLLNHFPQVYNNVANASNSNVRIEMNAVLVSVDICIKCMKQIPVIHNLLHHTLDDMSHVAKDRCSSVPLDEYEVTQSQGATATAAADTTPPLDALKQQREYSPTCVNELDDIQQQQQQVPGSSPALVNNLLDIHNISVYTDVNCQSSVKRKRSCEDAIYITTTANTTTATTTGINANADTVINGANSIDTTDTNEHTVADNTKKRMCL